MISKHWTIPVPDSLKATWIINLTFHFWHKSFILDDVKLAELSNNSFEGKNVTFLWGQNILWPLLYIFWGQDPRATPRIYAPTSVCLLSTVQLTSCILCGGVFVCVVIINVRFPPVRTLQQEQTQVRRANGRIWNCFLQGKTVTSLPKYTRFPLLESRTWGNNSAFYPRDALHIAIFAVVYWCLSVRHTSVLCLNG